MRLIDCEECTENKVIRHFESYNESGELMGELSPDFLDTECMSCEKLLFYRK